MCLTSRRERSLYTPLNDLMNRDESSEEGEELTIQESKLSDDPDSRLAYDIPDCL